MTDRPAGRRLSIDADLALSIDGVDATLVGARGDLTLRTAEPAKLLRVLRTTGVAPALRHAERTAGGMLRGTSVTVEGPRGRIVAFTAGAGDTAPSATSVSWHRPQDLVPASVRWVVAVVVSIAVVLAWRRRR